MRSKEQGARSVSLRVSRRQPGRRRLGQPRNARQPYSRSPEARVRVIRSTPPRKSDAVENQDAALARDRASSGVSEASCESAHRASAPAASWALMVGNDRPSTAIPSPSEKA
jgi:hypothetical protein